MFAVKLAEAQACTRWEVTGKAANKAEFVTCGRVMEREEDSEAALPPHHI